MTDNTSTIQNPGKGIRIGLWVVQSLAFAIYVFSGFTKFTTPIHELSEMMPWTGQYPEHFVRFIGLVDLAGGIGILLPSLTRILPRLTVLAALGCTILQVLAIAFHASRGEFMVLPFNAVLISMSIFVLWGRAKKAPITAHR